MYPNHCSCYQSVSTQAHLLHRSQASVWLLFAAHRLKYESERKLWSHTRSLEWGTSPCSPNRHSLTLSMPLFCSVVLCARDCRRAPATLESLHAMSTQVDAAFQVRSSSTGSVNIHITCYRLTFDGCLCGQRPGHQLAAITSSR